MAGPGLAKLTVDGMVLAEDVDVEGVRLCASCKLQVARAEYIPCQRCCLARLGRGLTA